MKKNFFLILLIFFLLLSKEVLSNEDVVIKKIAEGLDLPAHLSKNEFISKNSIFVLEHKLGKIVEIQNYNKDPKINQKPILNIKSLTSESNSLETGFTGFAFSPNFEEDKYIFVSYVNKKNQTILSRFEYDDKIKQAKLSSEVELLSVERLSSEDIPYHNCGTISFNPKDNYLYICLGDTRVPESPQNICVLNGKISSKNIVNKSKNWKLLLNKVKLHAHKKHNFKNMLMKNKKINYIRINIYPDGGISRIRVFGKTE